MSKNISALDTVRRAQFENEVTDIMRMRHPRQYALLDHFSRESNRFVQLRKVVLDHYIFEHRQLSPLFAVDALVQLVDRMVENMHQTLPQAA